MNVKYHIACGLVLDVSLGTHGVMTLFSILPDSPLVFNEIKLYPDRPFNADDVPNWIFNLYMTTHSLFFLPLVFSVSHLGGWAYLIHIITDWFTHTGRFSSLPLFPFPYQIKFGREILK